MPRPPPAPPLRVLRLPPSHVPPPSPGVLRWRGPPFRPLLRGRLPPARAAARRPAAAAIATVTAAGTGRRRRRHYRPWPSPLFLYWAAARVGGTPSLAAASPLRAGRRRCRCHRRGAGGWCVAGVAYPPAAGRRSGRACRRRRRCCCRCARRVEGGRGGGGRWWGWCRRPTPWLREGCVWRGVAAGNLPPPRGGEGYPQMRWPWRFPSTGRPVRLGSPRQGGGVATRRGATPRRATTVGRPPPPSLPLRPSQWGCSPPPRPRPTHRHAPCQRRRLRQSGRARRPPRHHSCRCGPPRAAARRARPAVTTPASAAGRPRPPMLPPLPPTWRRWSPRRASHPALFPHGRCCGSWTRPSPTGWRLSPGGGSGASPPSSAGMWPKRRRRVGGRAAGAGGGSAGGASRALKRYVSRHCRPPSRRLPCQGPR